MTAQLVMWDAGTEVDQEPGIGTDQGPRQKARNTGKAENGVVHKVQDGKLYSQASSRVMIPSYQPIPEMTGLGDSRSPFAGVEDSIRSTLHPLLTP